MMDNAACSVYVLIQEPRLSLTDPVAEVMMVMMMLRGVNSPGCGVVENEYLISAMLRRMLWPGFNVEKKYLSLQLVVNN